MSTRTKRRSIANETVEILERGEYHTSSGKCVEIRTELQQAIGGSVCYTPAELESLTETSEHTRRGEDQLRTRFDVINTTTFAAARQLVQEDPARRVVCLNFASAKNPGGGFLGGSQAQEESLARASGLYACINPQQSYYQANRESYTCLYTDHVIYSPSMPVFRDDQDELLEEPFAVSIITAPAVNAGAMATNEPENLPRVAEVMLQRMEYVLRIAQQHGHDYLVLGAWGCGVFRNNPADVARWFAQHLHGQGKFQNVFEHVVFAVLDNTEQQTVIEPFQNTFQSVQH